MFEVVTEVLEIVGIDFSSSDQRVEAKNLLDIMQSFEFVFFFLFMRNILAITNKLSQALQRKDQDIVNAMNLVRTSKARIQATRDDRWTFLLNEVSSFCELHDVVVVDTDDMFVVRGRLRERKEQ